jgi:hypothetical protein
MVFGRDNLSKAAKDIVDHLQIVDNIRAIQTGQKELADSVAKLDDLLRKIEVEFRAVRAEIRSDTLRETQDIINAVQGGLNQRIQDLAVNIAVMQHDRSYHPDRLLPSVGVPSGSTAENPLGTPPKEAES